MKFQDLYKEASKKAKKANKEESAVLLLLMHASKLSNSEIYQKMYDEVDENVVSDFNQMLDKYIIENKPVQYIIGYETFYGYDFIVNEGCLIPRFETEELVENILYKFDELFDKEVDVVDIGTGSGCIAITLALEEKRMKVVATDISNEALELAKENASKLNANVEFIQGDMLNPVMNRKFDILVSNPPYIPDSELVDPLVKDNEPNIALFGGIDGMKFYKIILSQARSILKDKYLIAFEHAYDKGDAMKILAKTYFPEATVEVLKDMQGLDRMTLIYVK